MLLAIGLKDKIMRMMPLIMKFHNTNLHLIIIWFWKILPYFNVGET